MLDQDNNFRRICWIMYECSREKLHVTLFWELKGWECMQLCQIKRTNRQTNGILMKPSISSLMYRFCDWLRTFQLENVPLNHFLAFDRIDKNRIEFWLGLLLLVFVGVLSRDTSFRWSKLFFMKLFGSISSFKVLPRSVKYLRIVFLSYSGHHFVAVRDGDFLFTYCLWFQDNNGNPVPVNCSLPVGVGSSPTGILSSTYFKWV